MHWVLRKRGGPGVALAESRRLAGIPGLRILPLGQEEWVRAIELMEAHSHLRPNDALHAACAISAGIRVIVSMDTDFDRVKGIKRQALG